MKLLFVMPRWIQIAVVGAVFIGFLLGMKGLGGRELITYVIATVLLGLAFVFNVQLGLSGRATVSLRSDRANESTLKSKNDIAKLTALNADPFLAPISRIVLIPARSALLTIILFSNLWWGWICLLLLLLQSATKRVTLRVSLTEVLAGQNRRDRAASRLIRHLRTGKRVRGQYYIYLRPFEITGQLRAEDPKAVKEALCGRHPAQEYSPEGKQIGVEWMLLRSDLAVGWDYSATELNPEWETILEKGLRRFGKLVALGRPGESTGAGRILTGEDDWQHVFVKLSHQANGFVIIPSFNPGTLWEIEWLKGSVAFRNCYFFLPGWQSAQSDPPKWLSLRERLWPLLKLPSAMGTPCLFSVDSEGCPHVAILSGPKFASEGEAVRVLLTATGIQSAIETLIPVANGSRIGDKQHAAEIANKLLKALSKGREGLTEIPDLPKEILRHVEADNSAMSQLWSYRTFRSTPGLEELYYHGPPEGPEVILRQEGVIEEKTFVFYVNMSAEGGNLRLRSFTFISLEEDLRSQSYIWSANKNKTLDGRVDSTHTRSKRDRRGGPCVSQ